MSIVLDGSNLTTTGVINSGTAVASTSGTSIDFTGIPAGTKRITVMFNGVSTSGSGNLIIQIGAGSFSTSGYLSQAWGTGSGSGVYTTGFGLTTSVSASDIYSGIITIALIGSNTWVSTGLVSYIAGTGNGYVSGGNSPALSGSLDRVRVTTGAGTDTFDAGSINILYE